MHVQEFNCNESCIPNIARLYFRCCKAVFSNVSLRKQHWENKIGTERFALYKYITDD